MMLYLYLAKKEKTLIDKGLSSKILEGGISLTNPPLCQKNKKNIAIEPFCCCVISINPLQKTYLFITKFKFQILVFTTITFRMNTLSFLLISMISFAS